MAFTDNCGTIIIDAATTDIGRKRLAEGTFKITKYAFGDDEIDYALVTETNGTFELANASSTPLFEAFTQPNAVIDHGLVSHDRTDLLFLPILQTNEKISDAAYRGSTSAAAGMPPTSASFYYLAVNSETQVRLAADLTGSQYVLETNEKNGYKIIIESGIDGRVTTDNGGENSGSNFLPTTEAARDAYILSTNLFDNYFNIYGDGRFIERVLSPPNTAYFKNTTEDKSLINFGTLHSNVPISGLPLFEHYNTYCIATTPNLMFNKNNNGKDLEFSAIAGPRGSVTALNFGIDSALTTTSDASGSYKYTTYGTASSNLFGDGSLYDYIDTTVLVEGATSQAMIQLPLRVVRYAGT